MKGFSAVIVTVLMILIIVALASIALYFVEYLLSKRTDWVLVCENVCNSKNETFKNVLYGNETQSYCECLTNCNANSCDSKSYYVSISTTTSTTLPINETQLIELETKVNDFCHKNGFFGGFINIDIYQKWVGVRCYGKSVNHGSLDENFPLSDLK
jgi:hypothetical protein